MQCWVAVLRILAKQGSEGSIGGEPQCRVRRSLVGFSEGDTVSGLEPLLVAATKIIRGRLGAKWASGQQANTCFALP